MHLSAHVSENHFTHFISSYKSSISLAQQSAHALLLQNLTPRSATQQLIG
jgi:hypothetical protein